MKVQTLFLIASTLCGALAAPIPGQPVKVVTVYEVVKHVVTVTHTTWVKASDMPALETPAIATTTEEYKEEETTTQEYPTTTSTPIYDATTSTTRVEEPTTATYAPETTSTYVSPEPTESEAPEDEEPEEIEEEEIVPPTPTYTPPTSTPKPVITTKAPEPKTPTAPVATPKPLVDDETTYVAPENDVTTGEATFYDTGMGSCGQEHTDDEYVVAISKDIMMKYDNGNPNKNPLCGKRIKCIRGGKEVIATVVDTCPGCKPGHVDLARAPFKELGEFDEGNIDITWYWVDPINE